jgi:L,D-peptidoglycan transpeptidase YkuD (ErfK/YbiS/YcfS/YnhG family)
MHPKLAAVAVALASVLGLAPVAAARLVVPPGARQLVVVSSPTDDPPGPQAIAELRVYVRVGHGARWRRVWGPWASETGAGHLVAADRRREGDHATPIGVFSLGHTIYGTAPDPGGLHYRYHHLVCGDWWDEDPQSRRYNRFVHLPCGTAPSFGGDSEPLWTETQAYPYFAVIDFNTGPVRRGADAPGSAIFLHSWVGSATDGCIALPRARLLRLLRWLRPAEHPMIEVASASGLARIR